MRSGTHGHGPSIGIFDLLARIDELPEVIEFGRAIGIGKHHVLAANMSQAMRNRTTLASILGDGHHPDRPWWDRDTFLWLGRPRTGVPLGV